MLIGLPGKGKTSLACSTYSPLILPFDDGGEARSAVPAIAASVEDWNEMQEVINTTPEEVAEFDTIVVDTVGEAVKRIKDGLVGSKFVQADGSPTKSGWGEISRRFDQWLKGLKKLGKDIVLISHAVESVNNNEITTLRPAIMGSSEIIAVQNCDCIGNVITGQKKQRQVTFALDDAYITKDPARLGTVNVPEFPGADIGDPGTMAWILQNLRDSMQQAQKAVEVKKAALQGHRDDLKAVVAESDNAVVAVNTLLGFLTEDKGPESKARNNQTARAIASAIRHFPADVDALNVITGNLRDQEEHRKVLEPAARALSETARTNQFSYNKETGEYENPS